MTITEESRYQLYKKLEATLGPDDANTMMEHLPPVGWADVATKTDLAHLQAATKADVDLLRRSTEAEFTLVRSELASGLGQMRSDLDTGLAQMRSDLDTGLAQMRSDLDSGLAQVRSDLAEGLHRQFVQLIASTAAMLAMWGTLMVIVSKLLGS